MVAVVFIIYYYLLFIKVGEDKVDTRAREGFMGELERAVYRYVCADLDRVCRCIMINRGGMKMQFLNCVSWHEAAQ